MGNNPKNPDEALEIFDIITIKRSILSLLDDHLLPLSLLLVHPLSCPIIVWFCKIMLEILNRFLER